MADQPGRPKEPVKTIAGQPIWMWGVAGAVVIVAGVYLYRKNVAASSAATPASAGSTAPALVATGPPGYGSSFETTLGDLHAAPTIVRQCPPGYNYRVRGPHAGHCVRASKASPKGAKAS